MPRSEAEQDFQEAYAFQRRDWTLQRIGWGVMALFILAAVSGVFGNGPLSSRTVGDSRFATMDLQRFARHAAPTTFTVTAGSGAIAEGELTITADRAFFEAYQLQSITPEPLRVVASEGLLTFVFEAGATRPAVTFHVEPQRIGSHSGVFRVGAGAGSTRLRIAQFVYP